MANSKIVFYPVGNGNMTFIKLNDKNSTTILVDMNLRKNSHKEKEEDFYDALNHLKKELKKDKDGRYHLDAFILTHADDDHILGLRENFYLGDPDNYSVKNKEDELIIINEIWSSCRFWNRKTDDHILGDDARAFNTEMKRRVKLFEDNKTIQSEGNRAIIIGSDNDKTEKVKEIVYELESDIKKVNNRNIDKLNIIPLGPLEQQEDESDDEYKDGKNRFSVILQVTIKEGSEENKILLTGDAEVEVWEWNEQKYAKEVLEYDILQVPHHCSWYSLSHDDSKEKDAKVSIDAKKALSYAKDKKTSIMVASSKPLKEKASKEKAKEEYLTIISNNNNFKCTEEYKDKKGNLAPVEINLTSSGTQVLPIVAVNKIANISNESANTRYQHGQKLNV